MFFFCCGPARTLTHSLWAGAISARPGWCFFFLLRPRRVFLDNNKNVWGTTSGLKRPGGATAKKKTPLGGVFFLLWPRAGAQRGFSFPCLSPGPEQKKKHLGGVFFFALAPCRRPTGLLLPLPFAGAGAKKNTLGGVFFFCSGPVPARGFSFPCLSPGPEQKQKNTLGGVFFFAAAPRGRSLTHCGPGWRCLPLAGVVFFFFAVAPPGRSLTHCGLGRFRQGPGGVLFLLRPRRVFLDNNKKCLGYYIGSKKTRRGHSKKKNTTSGLGLEGSTSRN